MKMALVVVTLFSLMGCASYQGGESSNVEKGENKRGYKVSASIDNQISSSNYRLVNIYHGNKSNDWVRLKRIKVVNINDGDEKTAEIVSGRDLVNWAESAKYMKKVDDWNRDILLGSIALAGAVAGSSSSTDLSNAGLGLYMASSSALVANGIMDGLTDIERAKLYPNTHIYSPFSVPAQMYLKRWLLIKADPKNT